MSRLVYNVAVQTVWPDGFKSEVRGDAITATRKTLEAMRKAGAPYDLTLSHRLRDATQAMAVRVKDTDSITVGRVTLNIRCAKEGV